MATKRDYYEVLGVARTASDGEISAAYRKLAIKFHPDSNPGNEQATERFKEAAEAYEVLSDKEKRSRYNQFGHAGVNAAGASGAGFSNVEDIFDAFGDIFGFGDMFGSRRRQQRGADIKTEVTLTLEEAASGVTKEITFHRSKPCKTCDGSGAKPGSNPTQCRQCGGHGQVVQSAGILRVQTTCPTCRGSGRIITENCQSCRGRGFESDEITLDIQIPPGVDGGMQVRLQGEGEPGPHGSPAGDCYCFIRLQDHPLFQRDGSHLYLQIPISYTQAVLGAEIDVPTLEDPAKLTIPPGTESGQVFQLRGRGMPSSRGRGRGDLRVQTVVEVPKKLSPEEEALLRQLAEVEEANVAPRRKSFLDKFRDYFGTPAASEES